MIQELIKLTGEASASVILFIALVVVVSWFVSLVSRKDSQIVVMDEYIKVLNDSLVTLDTMLINDPTTKPEVKAQLIVMRQNNDKAYRQVQAIRKSANSFLNIFK